MTTFKKTTAGMERDGERARARYDSVEFDIPPEVLSQGMAAITDWINKSPKYIAGTAITVLVAKILAESVANDGATGLHDWCEIELTRGFLDFFEVGRNWTVARVIDDVLMFRRRDNGTMLQVPTAVVGSLSSLRDGGFVLQYLDGTFLQGSLEEDELLLEPRAGILNLSRGAPERIPVKRIKLLRSMRFIVGERTGNIRRYLGS